MTPQEAMAWAQRRLHRTPVFATRLEGGLMNHVHRVIFDNGHAVVVKRAPPHVAAAPDIALSAGRAELEAQALRAVGGGPIPALVDIHQHTLILEDIGDGPHLGEWLVADGDPAMLDRLARWLRQLHDSDGPGFVNHDIQQTRLAVQYRPVGDWLAERGLADAHDIGQQAISVGRRLARGGPDFVMGDLWPPSVQVRADRPHGFVVLDWEMATAGHRAQDIGHLCAHLALDQVAIGHDRGWVDRFLHAYGPLPAPTLRLSAGHQGCEMLARTIGAFPRQDLASQAGPIVDHAVGLLRSADRPLALPA